ncbi:MAG: hypothetical protein DPW18_06060 [Chloroflexi bacterium]|nr:hypothetical protein [Chloroflexota bacterium]MDL1941837.1 hypothetical protein [Chloroflexi bacterium CFX2]
MSCDYQRNRIWCRFREWYREEVPERIRDKFESEIEDFVVDWVKGQLEGEGRRAVRAYQKTKKAGGAGAGGRERKKTGGGKSKEKKKAGAVKPVDVRRQVIADPPPFEKVYRMTKDIVVPGHIQWQDDQREAMADKMRRVMRWMRVHGDVPDADPIHGKHNLPRISSVAAYAAVHDWLAEQGVKMTSRLDTIYETMWKDENLTEEQIHNLGHDLERLEIEMSRKKDASPEQVEEILSRIYEISPEIYGRILRKFPRLLAHAVP